MQGRGGAGLGGRGGRGRGAAAAAAPAAAPVWVEVEPYVVPAKSHIRITACALVAKYYKMTGRELDVVQCFDEEWKAILERKKKDDPPTPKLLIGVPVHKWMESLRNHLNAVVGV